MSLQFLSLLPSTAAMIHRKSERKVLPPLPASLKTPAVNFLLGVVELFSVRWTRSQSCDNNSNNPTLKGKDRTKIKKDKVGEDPATGGGWIKGERRGRPVNVISFLGETKLNSNNYRHMRLHRRTNAQTHKSITVTGRDRPALLV